MFVHFTFIPGGENSKRKWEQLDNQKQAVWLAKKGTIFYFNGVEPGAGAFFFYFFISNYLLSNWIFTRTLHTWRLGVPNLSERYTSLFGRWLTGMTSSHPRACYFSAIWWMNDRTTESGLFEKTKTKNVLKARVFTHTPPRVRGLNRQLDRNFGGFVGPGGWAFCFVVRRVGAWLLLVKSPFSDTSVWLKNPYVGCFWY